MGILLFLVACSPSAVETIPLPTATSTSTVTVTPTTVWFPATETPTPLPTATVFPTLDLRVDVGEILYEEQFASGEGWHQFRVNSGSVAVGKLELTIAVSEPKAYLSSMYNNQVFGDFYLEVSTSTSLCANFDEYGVLFRAVTPGDFYRYSLSCNGNVRLDRLYKGVPSSPQPWTFSSAVPPAAPATTRLGIWALGDEMRFFIDDQYQFSVSDPVHASGMIGFFARSTGENAVTINFKDLIVSQVIMQTVD